MPDAATQEKQGEWHYQWNRHDDRTAWLFREWIEPNTLESFEGCTVLEAGCGGGHHTRLVAPYCKHLTAVDLNAAELAAEKVLGKFDNVTVKEGDIARIEFEEQFDVVFCVGVIHHTDDPDATAAHLKSLVKPGGRLIIWCYSDEGNKLMQLLVERPRQTFLAKLPRQCIAPLAWSLTLGIYPIVQSLYRLPLKDLPYYEYMQNWRRLSPSRNMMNVYDKLNAPQTQFIDESRVRSWAAGPDWTLEHLDPYVGVSWRLTLRRAS